MTWHETHERTRIIREVEAAAAIDMSGRLPWRESWAPYFGDRVRPAHRPARPLGPDVHRPARRADHPGAGPRDRAAPAPLQRRRPPHPRGARPGRRPRRHRRGPAARGRADPTPPRSTTTEDVPALILGGAPGRGPGPRHAPRRRRQLQAAAPRCHPRNDTSHHPSIGGETTGRTPHDRDRQGPARADHPRDRGGRRPRHHRQAALARQLGGVLRGPRRPARRPRHPAPVPGDHRRRGAPRACPRRGVPRPR